MTVLSPMPPASFAAYREASASAYAEDNVASGRWPKEGALERALQDFDQELPQGLATPGNYIYDIKDEVASVVVGVIWFAMLEKNGLKSAFVYDVEIKPEHRRKGHASAAFKALESEVRSLGLASIGLHVFGHNPAAQHLYSSLGYGVTGINMLKHLPPG